MVLSFRSIPPMRNASAKRRVQGYPLRMTLTPIPKTSSVILKILIQNYLKEILQKYNHLHNLRWKLRKQQPLVWIRIFRINHNVVSLGRKVIIKRYFHSQASRRCVTHRRKEGWKVILYEWPLHPYRRRLLQSCKSWKSWFKTRWQRVNITLKPIGEKTRSIATLQGIKKHDELDDLMLGSIVP